MLDTQPAAPSDVSDDDLASLDAPSEASMKELDDDALVDPDDRPDVAFDGERELDSACGAPGNYASWGAGTQLVTTEWLNLRKAPGIDSSIILVMPPSTAAVTLSSNCGHRWVHIADGSHDGYAAIDWLRTKSKAEPAPAWQAFYSPSRGKDLARTAWRMWHEHGDAHICLHGVHESIDHSISPSFETYSVGASQFGDYALEHTAYMRDHHLKAFAKGDPDAPTPSHFPKGTIIVWHHGHCGSDPTYGHVEVVVNDEIACSDYCRKRSDQSCAPDVVILPRH